ncbi:hypothetical protein FOZ60_006840 [Perkinsus olseni]|uniref:Ribulose-phosphate 3-epimerase n=1 Tax=Perkinsus olseni TaxID=32597 RepID=A0A7J6NMJ7_PEROL|nr:hypothetical protein FOZ60_006840 [Perkinsus olseni]
MKRSFTKMSTSCKAIVAPSVLAADFAHLARDCDEVLKGGADWLHLDFMDGHFVPNLSFGFPVVESLDKYYKKQESETGHAHPFFDAHIMVSNPMQWIEDLKKCGCNQVDFHIEAVKDHEECLKVCQAIREHGMRVGIAIKPKTPVSAVQSVLDIGRKDDALSTVIDDLLVMTVEPGFGGQKFMPDMMIKVEEARKRYGHSLDITVDGGLNPSTSVVAGDAGANVIVAGSAVFRTSEPESVIGVIRKAVEEGMAKRAHEVAE